MKITKYEHACFTVEKDGKVIIVDPGAFTKDLGPITQDVIAVIITHEHPDHFDDTHIKEITAAHPNATVFAPAAITEKLTGYATYTVDGGDSFDLAGFHLDFYGHDHAIIHSDMPHINNVGVLIDETLYYPGDAFTVPEKKVAVLALPVSAPWMKISESVEFMKAISAELTFPTHDAILSSTGQAMMDRMLSGFAKDADTEYRRIHGETITV